MWLDAIVQEGRHATRLYGDLPYFCQHALKLRRGFNFPAHRNLRVSEGVENLLR
jgi:hypothetical protein